jgi:uncharacterized membrane protein
MNPENGMFAIERRLGRLLTVGTRVSTASLGLGLALAIAWPRHRVSLLLLSVGIVTLMATPIARVALCVLEFARQRDWWFTFYTLVVFVLLVGSVIVAWLA